MIIFCAFLALLMLCQNFLSLAICLFGLGMALGCDYPTAHMIISESIPSLARGKLVLGAFAFQAVGALVGTGVGCLVLVLVPELSAWRWMFATALCPGDPGDHRAVLHHRKPELAVRAGASREGRGRGHQAAGPHAAISVERSACSGTPPTWRRPSRPSGPVQQPQPARHDLRLGSLVHPGSRHLRHRHLHARPSWPRPWAAARITSAASAT